MRCQWIGVFFATTSETKTGFLLIETFKKRINKNYGQQDLILGGRFLICQPLRKRLTHNDKYCHRLTLPTEFSINTERDQSFFSGIRYE